MQRVKNVDYDEDDLYDEDEEYGEESDDRDSEQNRSSFAELTPVVRAELEEAGVQASDKAIEDALWNSFWDVGKSAVFLKNRNAPKQTPKKQEKAKSKFDQAAERSAKETGELNISYVMLSPLVRCSVSGGVERRGTVCALPAVNWFHDVPWTLPFERQSHLVPAVLLYRPRLLGGSSKLAKLAEERRKKAAATAAGGSSIDGDLSSLDRLTKPRESKENDAPSSVAEPRKYPIRKKREPTPPPKEPTPPPSTEPEEEKPDLRASPTAFARTLSTNPMQGRTATAPTLADLLGTEHSEDPFKGPSPDDTVLKAQQRSKGRSLSKQTEALKLDSQSTQATVRSKGLDLPKLWAEEKAKRKPAAAFLVIGHVDHGKSTLMGRLLLDTGAVSQRDVNKYQKQAAEMNKSSFALAWVMDTGDEERERGVTFDFAQHHFSTPKADFTILDAPGHRDFVPNMIGGASMADMAVLVVDANQLESGMKGQTKEHILLAKAVGLKKVVVAVNKLDAANPAWSQDLFEQVQADVRKLLLDSGFAEQDIKFVPCSGLGGANVVNAPKASSPAAWVSKAHFTLLQALERSIPPRIADQEVIRQPLRMQIVDVFRGGVTNPVSIAGRISSGSVQIGDIVTVRPSGEKATIRAIDVLDEAKDYAVAGQICSLHLSDIEAQHLRSGDLVCSLQNLVYGRRSVVLLIDVLEPLLPQPVDVHVGRLHVPATISQLVETVDGKGEQLKRRPRLLKAGQRARIKVSFEGSVPLVVGERVIVRTAGVTAAHGTVE
ncbi:hypothetical protein LTR10_007781 [Elasticomyces elasticus]|nr:hypothetical protein LTR10_007781 [Elasticomyces elasticus]